MPIMLTNLRKQIVEKIVERDGLVFRVFFAVSNEFGEVKAEIIKVEELGRLEDVSEAILLPCAKEKCTNNYKTPKSSFEKIVSPYSSLIFVNGSKPRAPTF